MSPPGGPIEGPGAGKPDPRILDCDVCGEPLAAHEGAALWFRSQGDIVRVNVRCLQKGYELQRARLVEVERELREARVVLGETELARRALESRASAAEGALRDLLESMFVCYGGRKAMRGVWFKDSHDAVALYDRANAALARAPPAPAALVPKEEDK